ncbi:NucA/NucB deoxyribonuclease domain-containing protein [Nocardia brasiliensis]
MRSDCQQIPDGFTKEQADKAETMEAALAGAPQQRSARVAEGCQVYWPAPYEVCGAIRDKYNELGGPNSFLLFPTSNELSNPDGVGKRSTFQNGPIYWSPAGGAHPVVNHFFAAWQRNGWEGGVLGYPTSDEIVNPDNVGRRQYFQGGTIYWKLNEAYYIAGAIRDKWGETGWEGGYLGYPTSDETGTPDGAGRFNRFERGVIYWTPQFGPHPVSGGILNKWAFSGYEQGSWGYPTADQIVNGSNSRQQFEYGLMSWPTQQIADAAVVDDGEIAPNVDGPTPTTVAGFAADSRAGTSANQGVQLVSGPAGGKESCEPNCVGWDLADLEEPTLPNVDTSDAVIDPRCFNVPADMQWRGGRKFGCLRYQEPIKYIRGQTVSTIPVTVTAGLRSSHKAGGFVEEFKFEFGTATGEVGKPVFLYKVSGANFDKNNSRYAGPKQGTLVPQGGSLTVQMWFDEQAMNDGAVDTRGTRLEVKFGNFDASYSDTGKVWFDMNTLRCDKTMRTNTGFKQGCVFPNYRPAFDMDASLYPEAVGHVSAALAAGIPGTSSSPLHREANVAARNQNRRVACPAGTTIMRDRQNGITGRSCDEFPFASTKEGANSAPNSGRTFNPQCHVPDLNGSTATGWSVCMIDDPQNRLAGSWLGSFYGSNRVIDNDSFYVLAAGGHLPNGS